MFVFFLFFVFFCFVLFFVFFVFFLLTLVAPRGKESSKCMWTALPQTNYFTRIPLTESLDTTKYIVFVCVEVLRPSHPNGARSSAVSLPNHTFTGQA